MTRAALVLLPASLLVAAGGFGWWRTRNIGSVQRGFEAASRHGCLACHGEAGRPDDPHPAGTGGAPAFDREDVTTYARDADEIREWILDGKPRRLREEQKDEPPPLVAMPAFRGVLSAREVEDLVAWIQAVSGFEPIPDDAAEATSRRGAGRTTRSSCATTRSSSSGFGRAARAGSAATRSPPSSWIGSSSGCRPSARG